MGALAANCCTSYAILGLKLKPQLNQRSNTHEFTISSLDENRCEITNSNVCESVPVTSLRDQTRFEMQRSWWNVLIDEGVDTTFGCNIGQLLDLKYKQVVSTTKERSFRLTYECASTTADHN